MYLKCFIKKSDAINLIILINNNSHIHLATGNQTVFNIQNACAHAENMRAKYALVLGFKICPELISNCMALQ